MNDSFFTRRRLMLFISVLSLIFGIWWFFFRKFETYIFTITTYPSATATVPAVVSRVDVAGGRVSKIIDIPDVDVGIIIARFPKPGFAAAAAVAAAFPREVVFEKDASFRPIDGSELPKPSNEMSPNYALDQITGSGEEVASPSENCSAPVRIIAIDSGITQNTEEFPSTRVTFGTPWVTTGPPPNSGDPFSSPPSPDAWLDQTDHGTKVLSASIGAKVGIHSRVKNINSIVQSINVHRSNNDTAFTSDIVDALDRAVIDELARENDGNLRNNGTILTFPYRNFCGLSPALEDMLSGATSSGIIVVAGAGNDDSGDEPPLVTAAQLAVSPPPCSSATAFPASPSRNPGNSDLIFAGGSTETNSRWIGGNYSPQTDIFSPGENVTVRNANGSLVSANGTSMSTGYVAGALTWLVAQSPWITPVEARDWIMNPNATAQNISIPTSSSSSSTSSIMRPRLNLRNYTLPTTAKMSYARWRLAHNLPAAQSASDDFDYDSQVDFAEFVLGTNPRGRGDKGLRFENGQVICPLAFYLTSDYGEKPFELQSSLDLVTWKNINSLLVTPQTVNYENDGIVHKIPASALPGPPNVKAFCRLVVTIPLTP